MQEPFLFEFLSVLVLGYDAPVNSSAIDLGQVHDAAASLLRSADQLYTSGRRELVELLASTGRPANRTPNKPLQLSPKMTALHAVEHDPRISS